MDAAVSVVKAKEYDVCVWLHTAKDPPMDEWLKAMEITRAAKLARGDGSRIRSLVISDGGAPNATQRGQLDDAFDNKPHKLVVVTIALSNPIKRGIATAISWINPAFRAVSPAQVDIGLTHLDLSGKLEMFFPELDRMQKLMAPVITLQMLKNNAARTAKR